MHQNRHPTFPFQISRYFPVRSFLKSSYPKELKDAIFMREEHRFAGAAEIFVVLNLLLLTNAAGTGLAIIFAIGFSVEILFGGLFQPSLFPREAYYFQLRQLAERIRVPSFPSGSILTFHPFSCSFFQARVDFLPVISAPLILHLRLTIASSQTPSQLLPVALRLFLFRKLPTQDLS